MKKIQYIIIACVSSFLFSCGGGGDGPAPVDPVTPPGAAELVFPANNEECNAGVSVSSTQSKVDFQWTVGTNVTSSEVIVKDLLTSIETKTTSTSNHVEITLGKDTPYKWWVISKATGTTQTAKSPEWKFYNSGNAVITHAPLAAEFVAPVNGSTVATGTVVIEWKGSDEDNDMSTYDVYFGTVDPPTFLYGSVTAPIHKIENISVTANTYYWKVVSKDSKGNSSTSLVFEFRVE